MSIKYLDLSALTRFKDKILTLINKKKIYYGTCSTAAGTQTKIVDCEDFKLETGALISVKFTNAQTYNGAPTLNVNSTGAKTVQYKGGTNAVRYIWSAGEIIDFTYDGTYFVMHERALATTTYYGVSKLSSSAISTSTALALTPSALNSTMQNIVTGYPVYSTSTTYSVGDRVRYNTYVYECITEISTAEAWTAAHWKIVDSLQKQIDDLENSIPEEVTESTVSGWGFTKNTGTYIKPSTGIPKNDLATEIKTSLGKADTALQNITSGDIITALGYTPPTPTDISINTGTVTISSGTTIINGYEITLPVKYQVGNNSLEVRLNSEILKLATSSEDGHYKEVGNSGTLSNKIQFYRTSSDGNWTLTRDIKITAVVKGVDQT